MKKEIEQSNINSMERRIFNFTDFVNEKHDTKLSLEDKMKKYILRTLYKDGPNSVGTVEGNVWRKLGNISDSDYMFYYRLFKSIIQQLSKSGDIVEYEERNTNFLKLK